MTNMGRPPTINHIGATLLLCLVLPAMALAQRLSYLEQDGGFLISEGKEEILFYQARPTSREGKFRRAHYIHPLYGLDGSILTEDFPEDHPHHRGVFWAWHQVLVQGKAIGDSWECRDFNWEVREVDLTKPPGSLVLAARVLWTSPAYTDPAGVAIPFLEDRTSIRIYPKMDHYRFIDFEIVLRPLVEGLQLGGSEDDKGYGGFSIRLKLPPDVVFSSEGGRVTPAETAVKAGNWMNISGAPAGDGARGGIVIISRNKGPDGHQPWILREHGSMQNAVFPGREPVQLPFDKPTVLRYRLVVYSGDLTPKTMREIIRSGSRK